MPGDPPPAVLPRGDWETITRGFRWSIAPGFTIHEAACDAWARRDPDRTAIVHLGEDGARQVWSYGRLKDRSDRLASALRGMGVREGDRVALLLPQSPEVMVVHFAAMKCGAVAVPLFTLFGEDALSFRLADSGARIVVTDDANLDRLAALAGTLDDPPRIVTTGGARRGVAALDDLLSRAAPLAGAHPVGRDDPAVLIYTSGTTGTPKGALHAHRVLVGHLPSVEMVLEGFPRPGDIAWTPADWAWIGGLMDLAMPALHYGVPLISHRMRKFDPERAFRLMTGERVTTAFLPPTALRLMRQADAPRDLALRSVCSGGESVGQDLFEWGLDRLGAPINELYGQTECNLVVSSSAGLGVRRPGTMGRAVPGHDVAIIDGEGRRLPPGETGEIAVRRPDPVMFLGYWRREDATEAKFTGEWMRTGDLGRVDDEGYFTYVARDDDIINSAGYRIGPGEIENCLTGDPDVVMAAAVGVPDPERGEVVAAFVILSGGAGREGLEDRLIARVRERVGPHLAPRAVEVVESLPMTATGKIMRRALRDRHSSVR